MHLLFTSIFHLKPPERKKHTDVYFSSIKVNPRFLKEYKQCFRLSLSVFPVLQVLPNVILNVTKGHTSPFSKQWLIYTNNLPKTAICCQYPLTLLPK